MHALTGQSEILSAAIVEMVSVKVYCVKQCSRQSIVIYMEGEYLAVSLFSKANKYVFVQDLDIQEVVPDDLSPKISCYVSDYKIQKI